MASLRIAADVGGTFTDLVVDDGAVLRAFKASTTPDDPAAGVLDAVAVAAAGLGTDPAALLGETELFVHGTTRALNAVLTGRTARTALLTTAGHPDILLFREGGRPSPFDLSIPYPQPLIPRALTYEVPERILADGTVRTPLDEAAVLAAITAMRAAGVEAVAVCLLWSVVDGRHEQRVGELLAEHLPGVPFTLSHELNPSLREYRRASSTALDASLKPLMTGYVAGLGDRLRDAGLAGRLLLVSSTGGTLEAAAAAAAPIHALNSGPAMAPSAARAVVAQAQAGATAIVFDSGGTTCDVSVVRDGSVLTTRETWLGIPGAGHITGFPSVDIRSIAAGGGSIARVDEGGLLHVGPQSAGADPGPACYGRGGTAATVTDASLIAGYLDPDHFLDGALTLNRAAAQAALDPLAQALGVSRERVAVAILELATEQMVGAIEQITLGQGVDPRSAVLVGGGGAAGLNVVAIARRLGAPLAIVPAFGAVLSAGGALLSPLVQEHAITLPTASDRFDARGVARVAAELQARCRAFHERSAMEGGTDWVEWSVEARYRSQVWDLVVEHPALATDVGGAVADGALADLVERFHVAHAQAFGVQDRDGAVELLTWRARACCAPAARDARFAGAAAPEADVGAERSAPSRRAAFGEAGTLDAAVVRDAEIGPGRVVAGPAIVEALSTSVVIPPGATVSRSEHDHLLIVPHATEAAR